jgi:hypothetical protein
MTVKEGTADPLKIFISYSRPDMATADSLVAALEAAGFTVFIDRRDLPYGEQWQQVLYEYIRDSDTVVFLVSERSVSSQWVRWELQQVTDLKKRWAHLRWCSGDAAEGAQYSSAPLLRAWKCRTLVAIRRPVHGEFLISCGDCSRTAPAGIPPFHLNNSSDEFLTRSLRSRTTPNLRREQQEVLSLSQKIMEMQ